MKNYIISNIAPLAIGVIIGLLIAMSFATIENIITKIAILKQSTP